jgi:antitoxin ParD1/3/4
MSTLNITLPDSMQIYIDEKIAQGGYDTASDYIRQLVSEDQKRAAWDRLESLALEGLDGGGFKEVTAEDWETMESKVWERHAKGNPA